MNAQTVLRSNGGKADELVIAFTDAAGTVARSIGATAGPLAERLEGKAGSLAKTVEALAKTMEERAAPAAQAVSDKADALGDDLEEKLEQARRELSENVKNFRFGRREGLILGIAVGVVATVWLIRKIDRQAAAERLKAASVRVGEATQELSHKAGQYAGLAGDRVGQVVQNLGTRAGSVVEQMRGEGDQDVEEAKQRLADGAAVAGTATMDQASAVREAGSGLDQDTRAAIDAAVKEVERVQEEAQQEARELGLSNGMKVVAFDGADIGRVQEVREDVFVLDRPKGSDLLVPLTEVARIEGTVAYLRIETGQVTKMGWEKADKS